MKNQVEYSNKLAFNLFSAQPKTTEQPNNRTTEQPNNRTTFFLICIISPLFLSQIFLFLTIAKI